MVGKSFRATVALLVVLFALAPAVPVVSAQQPTSAQTDGIASLSLEIDPAMLPVDMGQSQQRVFVPETGHTLTGTMLDYWRANGGASVYGNPISEPYRSPSGYFSQAFERGVFRYMPEVLNSDDPTVRLAPTGMAHLGGDRDVMRADGRRVAGDRRMVTVPASQDTERQQAVRAEGGRTSEITGFSISGPFGAWYDAHQGWFYLGSPISEPHRDRGVAAQVFENGVLLLRGDGSVVPAPLPRETPDLFGIDTTPIAQGQIPTYDESQFLDVPNPFGIDTTALPGRRSIVVDIDTQTLTAWQGDRVVLETLVSTGIAPNDTEVGAFHVRIKFPEQDMEGTTGPGGEVLAVGDDSGDEDGAGGEGYLVEDVPHVLYINYQAEALHGAYWHDAFGTPRSHGCINLPLDVAAFIYGWAPLGTAVTVVQPSRQDVVAEGG